jgi:hypothetical protein
MAFIFPSSPHLFKKSKVKSLATDALSAINTFKGFVVTDVSVASKVKSQKSKVKTGNNSLEFLMYNLEVL